MPTIPSVVGEWLRRHHGVISSATLRRLRMSVGVRDALPQDACTAFGADDGVIAELQHGDMIADADELAAGGLDDFRFLQVLCAVQVLAVDERQEFRVLEVIFPGESNQLFERDLRIEILQVQFLFRATDVEIGLFENGLEQALLALEIVVDHALVGFRLFGDVIDARAA